MKRKFKVRMSLLGALLFMISIIPSTMVNAAVNSKLLVGYWHNFDNGTGIIKLRDVSDKWDVINVSFGETSSDRAVVEFTPCYGTDEEFKSDIKYLQSKGKKVVLSIGGQNGVVLIPDEASKQKFINSMVNLVNKYDFDGIDIDLESGITLNAGDNDFKNPKTPQIVNLISAIKTISERCGSAFIVSMAPETAYVQGGITAYGNIWGAYLPIIYGLRDKLTYIHVQHYNAGGGMGMDGVTYQQGTADYEVAMTDMLLNGFPIENNKNNMFPALRGDQVMIGLPACPSAAPSGGYIKPAEMKKALDYITKGIPFGGRYKLSNESGYPGFRGLMTWSINWDAKSNFEFSNTYREYFGSSSTEKPTLSLKYATLESSKVEKGSFTLTSTIPSYNSAISYKIFEGNSEIEKGKLIEGNTSTVTLTKEVTNKPEGSYEYSVVVYDASGKSVSSNVVTVVVKNDNGGGTEQINQWTAGTSYKAGDIVNYQGNDYKCLQSHRAIVGWEPARTLSLWEKVIK